MSQPNQKNVSYVDHTNIANSEDINNGKSMVDFYVGKLQEAMGNPLLQVDVQNKLQALQGLQHVPEGRVYQGPLCDTNQKATSRGHEREKNEGTFRKEEDTRRHEI